MYILSYREDNTIFPSTCPCNVKTCSRNFSFSVPAREACTVKSWKINGWMWVLKIMCGYLLTKRTSRDLSGWCPWVTHGKRSRSSDRSEIQQSNGHLSAPLLQGIQTGRLHIILKPWPPADLTNSSTLSPSHKVHHSISANLKCQSFSELTHPIFNSYSENTKSNNTGN